MIKRTLKQLNLIIAAAFLLSVSGCGLTKKLTGSGKSGGDSPTVNYNSGGTKSGTNNSTTGNNKASGSLANDIVGVWEMQNQGKTRFTFDKDGGLTVKQEESAPVKATYTVLDNEAIEAKMPGQPKLIIIIKVSGDTMRMNTMNRGNETLKRIS